MRFIFVPPIDEGCLHYEGTNSMCMPLISISNFYNQLLIQYCIAIKPIFNKEPIIGPSLYIKHNVA